MGWQDDAIVQPSAPMSSSHWSDDAIVQPPPPRMTFEQMRAAHPEEYDTNSDAFKRRYGARGPNIGPVQISVGSGEAALGVGSSMVATPAAGVAGLAQGAWNSVVPKRLEGMTAADRVRQVQEKFSYQPRTEAGQNLTHAIQYPFEKLAEGADAAGNFVNTHTDSPLLASGVNTALQMAPALLLRGRGGAAASEGESAGAGAARGAAAEAPEVTAAKDYVARRTSLDWNSLSDAVQARLADIAKNAKSLDNLDPAAVERQARLESLPVPLRGTRGQLTRDRGELSNEGTLSATAGNEVAAIRDAQSPGIVANLEILKGKVSGSGKTRATAQTSEQMGASVQDALRQKLAAHEQRVKDLYKQAEASGELQGPVSPQPLIDLIANSPDLTHLGWVDSWLNKVGARTSETTGGITVESVKDLPLKTLEDLRQSAVAKAMNGGTDGYYAGKVIRAIDEATDGAGGSAYKAARAARRQQALEFDDQAGVRRLVSDRSRTDRATALEDTFNKTVVGGSIDDLNAVKRSLLTGNDTAARVAGQKAWRDMRAQTLQYIIDQSTKSVSELANGSTPVSAKGMQNALNAIGPEKLDAIFGPGTTRMLDRIMQATKDLRTEPERIQQGSPTTGYLVSFLERNLNRVPTLGNYAVGAVKTVSKIRKLGESSRVTEKAKTTPFDEAQQETSNALARERARNAFARSAPFAGATQGQR